MPESIIDAMKSVSGVSVKENAQSTTVTIRPSAAAKNGCRLRVNKNGKGYATSYTLSVGCAEARQAGFVTADGQPRELEKTIDDAAHTITYRVKE